MLKLFSATALFAGLLLLITGFYQPVMAASDQLEYKLKAAFLLNFAKFTSWPENFSESQAFNLCIFGDYPFGNAFEGIENKTIAAKPIELIKTNDIDGAEMCHLVYISSSERSRIENILENLAGMPILLVSDVESFAENGGIIEFKSAEQRLGFIVNHTQAKEVGLKINASLLDLAKVVL